MPFTWKYFCDFMYSHLWKKVTIDVLRRSQLLRYANEYQFTTKTVESTLVIKGNEIIIFYSSTTILKASDQCNARNILIRLRQPVCFRSYSSKWTAFGRNSDDSSFDPKTLNRFWNTRQNVSWLSIGRTFFCLCINNVSKRGGRKTAQIL